MLKHLMVHQGIKSISMASCDSNSRYQCNICGLQLVSKYSLNEHEGIHKEGLGIVTQSHKRKRSRNVDCDICGKNLASTSSLKYHKRNIHGDNQAEHNCDLCEKTFKAKEVLRSHKRTHSNLKSTCNQCGREVKNIFLKACKNVSFISHFQLFGLWQIF